MNIDEIIIKSKETNLSTNSIIVLHCIINNIGYTTMNINVLLELRSLRKYGMLDKNNMPTKIALELFNISTDFIPQQVATPIEDTFDEFLVKYIECFPDVILPSGKGARVKVKDIKLRMKEFLAENKQISEEIVLNATKMYINKYSQNGYMYMRNSLFFIGKKGEGSDLEAYCREYINHGSKIIGSYEERL
jgi:hypothetical protein